MVLVAALLVPGAAASTTNITFGLTIYGPCIAGNAPGDHVSITWRDSSGALKSEGSVIPSEYGSWEFCPTDPSLVVMPGDRIRADNGLEVRKYVVPNLTLHLDRVNNRAFGTGPAGRTIRLCSTWSAFSIYEECRSVRVSENGTWTLRPNWDIPGGIDVSMHWTSPKGDSLYETISAPQLVVTIGKPGLSGRTDPFGSVEVAFTGSQAGVATANGDNTGAYSGFFRDSSNHLVSVAGGDHVSAPSLAADADWIVPNVSGSANKQSELVTGSCINAGPGNQVRISVIRPGGTYRGIAFEWTGPDETFEVDFNNYWGGGDTDRSLNIRSGDKIRIDCFVSTGDLARWSFVVP